MSQKISHIKTKNLDIAFNPADFKVLYHEDVTEENLKDEEKKKRENDLYNEIIEGLEGDLEGLGMKRTYSSKILINEVAMNILFFNRTKTQMICRGPLREKRELKKTSVSEEKFYIHNPKKFKSISYEYFPSNNEEVHPLFDKLMPKLQKQINDGLKALGLLPSQTIERQKLVIIKKLRQQCETLHGEISVEATHKKTNNLATMSSQKNSEIKAYNDS